MIYELSDNFENSLFGAVPGAYRLAHDVLGSAFMSDHQR